MPYSPAHLTEQILEQIAEGALTTGEDATAREHLQKCAQCQAEVEAYRSLFVALSDLPRFAPSEGFADGVMARVRMAPETDPVYSRLVKWLPRTRRGWALLTASVVAPALPVIALVAWVLTQPMVTIRGLWQITAEQAADTALVASGYVAQWGAALGIGEVAGAVFETAAAIPSGTLGVAAAVLAVATPLSAWLLVRLVRSPMGNVTYAN